MSELKRMIDSWWPGKRVWTVRSSSATLEEAMRSAARRKLGSARLKSTLNTTTRPGEVEVFEFKEVVEVVDDPETQVSLEDAAWSSTPTAKWGTSSA